MPIVFQFKNVIGIYLDDFHLIGVLPQVILEIKYWNNNLAEIVEGNTPQKAKGYWPPPQTSMSFSEVNAAPLRGPRRCTECWLSEQDGFMEAGQPMTLCSGLDRLVELGNDPKRHWFSAVSHKALSMLAGDPPKACGVCFPFCDQFLPACPCSASSTCSQFLPDDILCWDRRKVFGGIS